MRSAANSSAIVLQPGRARRAVAPLTHRRARSAPGAAARRSGPARLGARVHRHVARAQRSQSSRVWVVVPAPSTPSSTINAFRRPSQSSVPDLPRASAAQGGPCSRCAPSVAEIAAAPQPAQRLARLRRERAARRALQVAAVRARPRPPRRARGARAGARARSARCDRRVVRARARPRAVRLRPRAARRPARIRLGDQRQRLDPEAHRDAAVGQPAQPRARRAVLGPCAAACAPPRACAGDRARAPRRRALSTISIASKSMSGRGAARRRRPHRPAPPARASAALLDRVAHRALVLVAVVGAHVGVFALASRAAPRAPERGTTSTTPSRTLTSVLPSASTSTREARADHLHPRGGDSTAMRCSPLCCGWKSTSIRPLSSDTVSSGSPTPIEAHARAAAHLQRARSAGRPRCGRARRSRAPAPR